ncbi:hypothetical protein [Rhodanobacter thiooxydans]|uniref:hypothetical protein n=1 Tax=Rhodanobacter thiooxydans TaxID=416169 RepID=UPI00128FF54C|nr:hypothetical protein [Rhodanobacter thiooxydans]MCW0202858.1 hypothetical protein [Rhodanobacter thiooxydans]
MNIAIAPAQATYASSRFSHRLARGLRRELFREFHERDREWQRLVPTVSLMTRASLATRERSRILGRLAPRMRAFLAAYHEHNSGNNFLAGGTTLLPVKQACVGGETEDALQLSRVRVFAAGGRAGFSNKPVALLGQHAVERLFERLATTQHAAVRSELASALAWFDLLHSACQSLSHRARPKQLVVPTETGAFLGQLCSESGLVQIRTWVATGSNNRIDRSLAALHAWRTTPTSDTADTFRVLLAQPCNQWMCQPYSRGY